MCLTSCVTVSVQTEIPSAPPFVTSTLPPTDMVTPRPVVTTAAAATPEMNCVYGAVLLEDVTFPDYSNVPAGKIFTKTWRFKNTGTCPWAGFTIRYASGEPMNASASLPVPETEAGGIVDVSVDLTAPIGDGTYTTHFSLQSPAGESIDIGIEKTFYVQVIVGKGGAPALTQGSSASSGTPAISVGNITIYCRYGYSENAGYVQELTSLINQARANAGVPALSLNPLLTQAAQGHSIDMACNNFLGHQGSDGSRFGGLVYAVGIFGFSEIIAIGTPQNAMDQWAADPGHWEFVLNPLATEMGVGYAYNPNSDFGGYFTVDFH